MDYELKPLGQLKIIMSGFIKCCGMSEYSQDGIGRVTTMDVGREWVGEQIFPGFYRVSDQGVIEESVEVGESV
jgi:hypothetical protein